MPASIAHKPSGNQGSSSLGLVTALCKVSQWLSYRSIVRYKLPIISGKAKVGPHCTLCLWDKVVYNGFNLLLLWSCGSFTNGMSQVCAFLHSKLTFLHLDGKIGCCESFQYPL